jgi:sugar (pentulose or hexulose) kinase
MSAHDTAPLPDEGPLLIGLDLGTSATKGVLADAAGRVLATAEAPTRLLAPREGWLESHPEDDYLRICGVIRELASRAPGEVAALSFAAASGNTLLSDSDGRPLMRVINWMDRRAAQQPPKTLERFSDSEVAQVVGWPRIQAFPLAHLAWLRENRPDLLDAAGHVGMDTDWLLHRLTGQWRMDRSTATTFYLQDQVSGAYHEPFLERLSLRLSALSPLADPGEPVGRLLPQAASDMGLTQRTLVVAGCFDHPAAARAAGVLKPGALLLSCGTSWVGFLPHPDRQAILDAGLLCDPFLSRRGGPWAGLFSVPAIGPTINWYIDRVTPPDAHDRLRAFNDLAARAEPGSGGLIIDLRAPPRLPAADYAAVSRAVMEGAARLLNEKIVELKARGFRYHEALMAGGASRSQVWPGIVAAATGLALRTAGASEGARGAALLAGLGCGLYRSEREASAAWKEHP